VMISGGFMANSVMPVNTYLEVLGDFQE